MRSCVRRGMQSRLLLAALLSTLWFPCGAPTPAGEQAISAASGEIDLESYKRVLTQIAEASKTPSQIPEQLRSLPDTWSVRDGERVYSVSTKEISEALRDIERHLNKSLAAQLRARLEAMRRQAEALAVPSPGTNTAQTKEKLEKIFERGEFREATGPSVWDLMRARINRWILEHLIKLFRMLHMSQKTGNAIGWGVLFLAVVGLFYVTYRWLTRMTRAADFRAEAQPMASDARRWVQEALAAADRSDFREAVHCAYWASVSQLEDLRILPRDRARTPRESLCLLEQHPQEQKILDAITRSFELIWYGYRPVSAAEWAGMKKELERMGCLQVSIAPTVPS
jgi:Domain of unknown function (DUF4129)